MKTFSEKNTLIIAVIILIALLFWYAPPVQDIFYFLTTTLEGFVGGHTVFGIFAFTGLAAISATVAPFSSIPLVPTATILWGAWPTFIFLLLGWVLGGTITYILGAFAVYPAIKFFASRSKQIEYWRRRIRSEATFGLVFLFRLALPAEIPCYVLGFTHYNFRKYILATMLAEAPIAGIAVFASGALIAKEQLSFISWLLVIVIILSASSVTLKKSISMNSRDD